MSQESHRPSSSAGGCSLSASLPPPLSSSCSSPCLPSPLSSPSYLPGTLSPASSPAPLSPDTKRRLAELSDDLTVRQKLAITSIWLLAVFYGVITCCPEKVSTRHYPTLHRKGSADLMGD